MELQRNLLDLQLLRKVKTAASCIASAISSLVKSSSSSSSVTIFSPAPTWIHCRTRESFHSQLVQQEHITTKKQSLYHKKSPTEIAYMRKHGSWAEGKMTGSQNKEGSIIKHRKEKHLVHKGTFWTYLWNKQHLHWAPPLHCRETPFWFLNSFQIPCGWW